MSFTNMSLRLELEASDLEEALEMAKKIKDSKDIHGVDVEIKVSRRNKSLEYFERVGDTQKLD